MKTYEFYDLSDPLLGTIATSDPHQAASEISSFTGVDADEVVAVEVDDCEACGTTAVCSPITLRDGDLIADLLVCDNCRLSLILSQMGRSSRERVAQLRTTK